MIFKWVIKNLWNIFGVFGVVATIYFSLFHVPDYVKEITSGKVNVIHESLMDDVQEMIFYEKEVSIEDIDIFIQGKELKQGVSYPYTSDELLIQVQERFIANKFIPLEKRDSLIKSIKSILANYSPTEETKEKPFDWLALLSWLLSGLGVIIGLLGAASIASKLKTDKETAVDIEVENAVATSSYNELKFFGREYEEMVGKILEELGTSIVKDEGYKNYDYLVEKNNNRFAVVSKKYNKLLGLSSARHLLYQVTEEGHTGIVIISSGVTQRSRNLFKSHNAMTEDQNVYIVIGETKEEIKKKLERIINEKTSNK